MNMKNAACHGAGLDFLGWDDWFETRWNALREEGCPPAMTPGRIVAREGGDYVVQDATGLVSAQVSGRLSWEIDEGAEPVVGDWCGVHRYDEGRGILHAVLPRRTELARNEDGRQRVLAANIDVLGIVTSLDGDFSVGRMLRFATLARQGGMDPLWILTKADLEGCDGLVAAARKAAGEIPVLPVSVLDGRGVGELREFTAPGRTIAFVGSSGVGKSTLVNALLGTEVQKTREVRLSDSKGRHTTTGRRIFHLPQGSLVMDTPGLRVIGLLGTPGDVDQSFVDIAALAGQCRFKDCSHSSEPGCAVLAAAAAGSLDPAMLEQWRKQRKEIEHYARSGDLRASLEEKARVKRLDRVMRRYGKQVD